MAPIARRLVKRPARPSALPTLIVTAKHQHGTVTSGEVLSALFTNWLESEMKSMQERLTTAEPAAMAHATLQRFLSSLTDPTDTSLERSIEKAVEWQLTQTFIKSRSEFDCAMANNTIERDDGAISQLRQHLRAWSEVQGEDIMRVFLSDESNVNGEAEQFFDGLKLCPNRAFTWRLVFPGSYSWPLNLTSFKQQLWVTKIEFIHDCIHDLGRPLPIMELGEIWGHMPDLDMLEQTIHRVLTPAELVYCMGYGVFQLDLYPNGLPAAHEVNRPRLRLNPLFTTSTPRS